MLNNKHNDRRMVVRGKDNGPSGVERTMERAPAAQHAERGTLDERRRAEARNQLVEVIKVDQENVRRYRIKEDTSLPVVLRVILNDKDRSRVWGIRVNGELIFGALDFNYFNLMYLHKDDTVDVEFLHSGELNWIHDYNIHTIEGSLAGQEFDRLLEFLVRYLVNFPDRVKKLRSDLPEIKALYRSYSLFEAARRLRNLFFELDTFFNERSDRFRLVPRDEKVFEERVEQRLGDLIKRLYYGDLILPVILKLSKEMGSGHFYIPKDEEQNNAVLTRHYGSESHPVSLRAIIEFASGYLRDDSGRVIEDRVKELYFLPYISSTRTFDIEKAVEEDDLRNVYLEYWERASLIHYFGILLKQEISRRESVLDRLHRNHRAEVREKAVRRAEFGVQSEDRRPFRIPSSEFHTPDRAEVRTQDIEVGEIERLEQFLREHSYVNGMVSDTTLYVDTPLDALPRIFSALRLKQDRNLSRKKFLSFGAGASLRDSMFANYYGMNVTAVEKDKRLFSQARKVERFAQEEGFLKNGNFKLINADALDISWKDQDVIFFFYTQSAANPEEYRKRFNAKLVQKIREMKPGAILTLLFTRGQLLAEQDQYPALDDLEEEFIEISTVMQGLYLKIYQKPYDVSRAEARAKFERSVAIAQAALQADGGDDYFVKPTIIDPSASIRKNDSVIFVNFRGDRADPTFRLLSGDPKFRHWPLEKLDLVLLPFGNYSDVYFREHGYSSVLSDVTYANTLGEIWAGNGLRQVRIAESEKFKHVTYFFDGLRDLSKKLPGLMTELIPSNKLERHDERPEMKAKEIADRAVDYILGRNGVQPVQAGVINFANSDILGHFDNFEAVVEGVQTVDEQIGHLWEAVKQVNGVLIVTADHGSAEEMAKLNPDGTLRRDPSGKPIWNKAHAFDNKVEFIVLGAGPLQFNENGSLKNVAPTFLQLQGLDQPEEMDAESLLEDSTRGQIKGRPVFIVIRDGQGINKWKDPQKYPEAFQFDAVHKARLRSPSGQLVVDRLLEENAHGRTELWAHGGQVGHPEFQMGDSETGHSNMGVGRSIKTPLSRLNEILEGADFVNLPQVRAVLDNANKNGRTLHLFGMVSPGGVHSHTNHFLKLLDVVSREQGIKRVVLHAVFDGRDTDVPGWQSLQVIQEHVLSLGDEFAEKFTVGDIAGRFFAMDRDGLNRDLA
ncbi:MAG: alkaline phosphatase family protein, partial [Candidatus Omnitrophica bacterium]|nr:alkaline phosphatase family protein [Candidatus Omnitrophota bacterium]